VLSERDQARQLPGCAERAGRPQVLDAAGREVEALPVDGQARRPASPRRRTARRANWRRPGGARRQPATVFGRDAASADVELDHASCSGRHAAVVHHQDARIFLIDLQSVRAPGLLP